MVKSKKTACIIIGQNYQKHIQSFFVGLQSVLRIHRMNIILITTLIDFGYTLKTPKLPFWQDNVKNNIDFTCMVQLHFQSLSTLSCKAIVIFNFLIFIVLIPCLILQVLMKYGRVKKYCLVPLQRFARPSQSIHFGGVSKANGRETLLHLDHVTWNELAARNNEA